jgi:hypothetical protein
MKTLRGMPLVTVEQIVRYQKAAVTIELDRDELLVALRDMRDEFAGLPHSLGYEYTHMPKVKELIARIEADK